MSPNISSKPGVGFTWAVRDLFTMVRRNLLVITRLPQLLVFGFVQPLIFVLMFRYVFGGAIKSAVPGQTYVDYLMPGIFTQTVVFGAISTAVGLSEDKTKGLLERLKSLPMSRSAVLGGRVVADSARNAVVVLMMLFVGFLVGFRTHTDFVRVVGGVVVLLAFGFAMCWVFAVIGLAAANAETAQAAAFPLIAPLVFASNAFVPTSTMPDWLRWWAERQPVSMTVRGVRALMLGTDPTSYAWGSLLWSLGITVVLAPLAVRRYRRA